MKKKKSKIITIFLVFYISPHIDARSAITYETTTGRFGDQLVAFSHALYLSTQYKLILLYKPFVYSDQLHLHKLHLESSNQRNTYKNTVRIDLTKETIFESDDDNLYILPYFPEAQLERADLPFTVHAQYLPKWEDPQFLYALRENIAPLSKYVPLPLPKDQISVAVHLRRGTGVDVPNIMVFPQVLKEWKSKFASDEFYIQQIKTIAELFPYQQLYVYLFTDHTNPQELINYYQMWFPNSRIQFACRDYNPTCICPLDDFFALQQFDCLIRPDSNFSIVASKLGTYKVQIYPSHVIKKNNVWIIDKVQIETRLPNYMSKEYIT